MLCASGCHYEAPQWRLTFQGSHYKLVHLLWILFASELRCWTLWGCFCSSRCIRRADLRVPTDFGGHLCLMGDIKKSPCKASTHCTLLSVLHSCPRDIKLERIMLSSLSLGKILAMIFQSLTMLSGSSGLEDRINRWQTPWTHTIKEEKVSLPLVPPPPGPTLKSHAWGQANESSFILLKRWQSALLPTWEGEVTVCTASHLSRVKVKKTQLVQERGCQSWGLISFSKLPNITGNLSQVSEKTLLIFFSLFCQPVNKPCFSLDFSLLASCLSLLRISLLLSLLLSLPFSPLHPCLPAPFPSFLNFFL